LINNKNGRISHIDFDCIFEKGKDLPTPEIIQFRFTKNIEACLGILGIYTLRQHFCGLINFYKKHIDDIIGHLDSFIYDPLINFDISPIKALESIKQRIDVIFRDQSGKRVRKLIKE